MPVTLLHLSDVHYGDDFIPWVVFKQWPSGNLRGWGRRPKDEIVAGLAQAVRDLKPAYVILSGDFVNKARPSNFSESAAFLRDLLTNAGIDIRRQVLLAPGNHDVAFIGRQPDAQKRLAKYNAFAKELYGTALHPLANYSQRDVENKLLFLVLDTTLKSAAPAAEGEVGTEQRKWVRTELERHQRELGANYSQYAKIAIMHHHIRGISGSSVAADRNMQLMDAVDILEELKRFSFDLVLHGHRHVPRAEGEELRSDGGTLTIVGAGTVLAPYPDQQGGYGNNFYELKIDRERRKLFVRLHHACENGTFAANDPPREFPLFPVPDQAFRQEKIRMIMRVKDNGDTFVIMERRGIQAVKGPGIKQLPIRIAQFAASSTIGNFAFVQGEGCTVSFCEAERPEVHAGVIEFDDLLTPEDQPKTVSYTFEVEKGAYMKAPGRGSAAHGFDETWITLASETDELEIELEFPIGFRTEMPKVLFEDSGVDREPEFRKRYNLHYDIARNAYTLTVNNPPLSTGITLRWVLPKNWP